ncbi:MAG: type II toxin-antitoxin system VapC family toxin [Bryobacteraceae bacterium]|nr:type II toxin-antitoxin system VapC family toxin [Bryobacteraceae bacterium]
MKKYVLDTNIYVTAARDTSFGTELVQFVGSFLPQIYLHAVVVQELMRGAITENARKWLAREIVQPFEKRGRILTPGYAAWKRSGEIIADLVETRVISTGGVPGSFIQDVLLAASCREQGVTLVTLNGSDFQRIRRVSQVEYVAPWPRK